MRDWSVSVVRTAAEHVPVAEEVAAFVRDMDFAGVEFQCGEWDREVREWTETMLREEDWSCEGVWRDRICGVVQGRGFL